MLGILLKMLGLLAVSSRIVSARLQLASAGQRQAGDYRCSDIFLIQ